MRLSLLFLAVALFASLACHDIGPLDLDFDLQTLTVRVMTTGTNLDADGYTLSVTSQLDEAIGVNESKVFEVFRMDVTARLSGVAANCTVDTNPQTVHVSGPTTLVFVVQCS